MRTIFFTHVKLNTRDTSLSFYATRCIPNHDKPKPIHNFLSFCLLLHNHLILTQRANVLLIPAPKLTIEDKRNLRKRERRIH